MGSLVVLRQGWRRLGRRSLQRNRSFLGAPFDFEGLETRLGWTAGAGVEWAFSNIWSVKVEYDFYGLGNRSVTFINLTSGNIGPENIRQNIHAIMLGINFRVWPGLAP